jgi:hypothetical protein
MPVTTKLYCPECDAELVRRPGGCCPQCGTDVRDHVLQQRMREKRIEQVVAVISTLLVVGVSLVVGGCNLVEGIVAYAVTGAVMYALAKRTFFEKGADRGG